MRKVLFGICVICLLCSLTACGRADSIPNNTAASSRTEVSSKTETDSTANSESQDVQTEVSGTESDIAWRQFMKDYEAWADTYVVFMKKYKDNPTDLNLITEYAEFVEKTAEWAEKAEDYQNKLESASPQMLGEYVETLGRITKKLVEAAY